MYYELVKKTFAQIKLTIKTSEIKKPRMNDLSKIKQKTNRLIQDKMYQPL